jgi:hypothetical protein
MFKKKQQTDEAFLEQLRYRIIFMDRYRSVAIVFYVLLTAGFIFLCFKLDAFIRNANFPGMGVGFSVGVGLGIMFGFMAIKLGHGLAAVMQKGFRSERLLLRYHDALMDYEREHRQEAMPPLG